MPLQPPLPPQPRPPSMPNFHHQYPPQMGANMGSEFNNQAGSSMQLDRGSWMSGLPESSTVPQLPGPPPSVPSQMLPGGQPPRPPPLSPETEKALLQQVMTLTPEQINLLPPSKGVKCYCYSRYCADKPS